MKSILYVLVAFAILSCDKTAPELDTVAPEYPDWYVLKAPVDRAIEGIWGDIDKTLLISTMFAIYRSTDRGQTWQQVHQQSNGMFGVVQYQDTLFTMSSLLSDKAIGQADNYSTDDGRIWKPYRRYNPVFEPVPLPGTRDYKFPINPVTNSNGTSYKINQVFANGPKATTGAFETPGVITSTGRRIDLPQLHQLNSLYFDGRGRLYVTGSDAVCGRGRSYGEEFAFCNSKNGRGVVYVSKNPMP